MTVTRGASPPLAGAEEGACTLDTELTSSSMGKILNCPESSVSKPTSDERSCIMLFIFPRIEVGTDRSERKKDTQEGYKREECISARARVYVPVGTQFTDRSFDKSSSAHLFTDDGPLGLGCPV